MKTDNFNRVAENHAELVSNLFKPGADIVKELQSNTAHVLHMAIGMVGELNELKTTIVANNRAGQLEELGDIEFYFEGLMQGYYLNHQWGSIEIVDMRDNEPALSTCDQVLSVAITILEMTKKEAIYGKDIPYENIIREASLFRSFLDVLYKQLSIEPTMALNLNMRKLNERYKDGKYSNKDAIDRVDTKGETKKEEG